MNLQLSPAQLITRNRINDQMGNVYRSGNNFPNTSVAWRRRAQDNWSVLRESWHRVWLRLTRLYRGQYAIGRRRRRGRRAPFSRVARMSPYRRVANPWQILSDSGRRAVMTLEQVRAFLSNPDWYNMGPWNPHRVRYREPPFYNPTVDREEAMEIYRDYLA